MSMSVNLIAPSKVQGCVLTRYIYIILLAALSLSISKPIFSFFSFWKIKRIRVISRTFDHIPAMIVVLKLQFVMSEMLEDVTQERRGRGNQIFEPSTFYPLGCAQTHAMISAQVWSWFDASFTMIWVIQIVHGVPKNFQQLQICQNKAWIWTPLIGEISNPLRTWMWGLHWILVFFLFQVDHTLCNTWFELPWWRLLWKHVHVSMAATMHVQKPLCQSHSLGMRAGLVKTSLLGAHDWTLYSRQTARDVSKWGDSWKGCNTAQLNH